jgi:hypothetical protein
METMETSGRVKENQGVAVDRVWEQDTLGLAATLGDHGGASSVPNKANTELLGYSQSHE